MVDRSIDVAIPVTVESGLVTVESGLGVVVQSGLWTMGIALADVSGEWVESHILSGEVTLPSTQAVKISGESVVLESGTVVVLESGTNVFIQSGIWTMGIALADISGEWTETHILSGEVTLPSTQVVKISGEFVEIVSGQTVQLPATQVVKTSGEAGYTPSGGFTAATTTVGAISGGVQLLSGAIISLVIAAPSNNSGDLYMGYTDYRPYSGYGFLLEPGVGVSVDIDNPNAAFFFAEVSGDEVSYMGVL